MAMAMSQTTGHPYQYIKQHERQGMNNDNRGMTGLACNSTGTRGALRADQRDSMKVQSSVEPECIARMQINVHVVRSVLGI
jgi:hypothetical protein